MNVSPRPWSVARIVVAAAALVSAGPASAGAFLFTGSVTGNTPNDADRIAHSNGYTGAGATLLPVTICVDPASPFANEVEQPLRNVAAVWSGMQSTSPNIIPAGNNGLVPNNQFDIESVLLHELGHCLGIGHPNLASESGLTDPAANATRTQAGPNLVLNTGAGADGRHGSPDDVRGDDLNLHWFQTGINNPFTVPLVVDRVVFTQSLLALPAGQTFPANPDRLVALNNYGLANTESVMQQLQIGNEVRRTLGADDVVTKRIANSGVDGIQGTSDDYTFGVSYAGQTTACNIVVRFNTSTSFGVCQVSASGINADHFAITSGRIDMNQNIAWYFNTPLIFANGFE